MKSALYVSRAKLPPGNGPAALESLLAQARARNEKLEITGCLVFTGTHFAQVLEGPDDRVEELMASIQRDERHHSIRRFEEEAVHRRLFPGWSLAFHGTATYVDRHIRPLFSCQHEDLPRARAELMDLLYSLVQDRRR